MIKLIDGVDTYRSREYLAEIVQSYLAENRAESVIKLDGAKMAGGDFCRVTQTM